ncbi:MAG: flagellar biosynthesis anti-sigma factor FlgM [Gammaproteobacteria bacterium]|nr:flagellar biosynthesis anti-sigma factor FlgM [Gammaproteobacteria bacterium]
MVDKINGYGRTDLPASSRSGGVKRAEQGESARSAGGEEKTRTDAVALTDTAVRLKRIEANLAELPEVDQAKVDALREQVDSGDYKVDGQEIARKLVQLEQDLS